MKRILVTGNAGSGKTSLAQQLALQLSSPVHSLDTIVWQSGWVPTPREEKEKMIADLAARGVSVFQDSHIKPSGRTTFLDTAKTGGIFFELIERRSE